MDGGRVNQKARTRGAILEGAIEILREGREPTVPEAAQRARVSPATAYRYFTSAEELQDEAAGQLLAFASDDNEIGPAIEAAGDDVHARIEALVRTLGWRMLADQAPFRQQAKVGLERWFAQQLPGSEPGEVRVGRRNKFLRQAIAPVSEQLDAEQRDRLLASLAIGFGTEAAISLTDVARLEPTEALEVMVVTCRWIVDGALADAGIRRSATRRR